MNFEGHTHPIHSSYLAEEVVALKYNLKWGDPSFGSLL